MRWTLPSWIAIALGTLLLALGFLFNFIVDAPDGTAEMANNGRMLAMANSAIIAGAILLGAGIVALQAAWTAWCSGGGCGCCGDECECGDCGDCCKDDGEHKGHDH